MISPDTFHGSIGALAEAAGVTVETIRFYQRKRLLAEPRRRRGEIRQYGVDAVVRVKFVKAAQRLGFTLGEIAGLLTLDGEAHCDRARVMAEGKLHDVRAKLRDLQCVESALQAVVDGCRATPDAVRCPLIAKLHATDGLAQNSGALNTEGRANGLRQ